MPEDTPLLLSRDELILLLTRMADLAEARDVRIEMFVVGDGAIALAYDATRLTGDLDAVFEPKQVVYDIAREVAADASVDLREDWLNDAVKGFLPGDDPHATVFFDRPGISVRVASPRYLFVLKAMSAREGDEDDLRLPFPSCGYKSVAEALDSIVTAYPRQVIKPNVQYLVSAIAAEFGVS